MAVSYDPRLGGGGGNLASAMGLFDQFFGMGSKLRTNQLAQGEQAVKTGAQQLTNLQQAHDINAAQEQRASDLQLPTLQSVKAVAGVHQNELAKSNTDESTRKGSIAALNNAPADLWTPTTAMSPDQLKSWSDLHQQNGVSDLSSAASAWNKAMGTMRGKFATPEGGLPTQYTTGPDGSTSVTGAVLPDLSKIPGASELFGAPPAPATPAAPAAQPPPPITGPVLPSAAPLQIQPPQQPGTAAPVQPRSAIPDLKALAPLMANPFTRGIVQSSIEAQNAFANNAEKQQALEKGQRELSFGNTEQQKAESEFVRNSAQMSHRLDQLKDVVAQHGNYGWTPEASALLKSLPLDLSDNWTKITNPGGVLREGLVHLNKELQIPISPQNIMGAIPGYGPRNETTQKAIDQTKTVLADYVRQYENLPTTKQPVAGLTPELRQLVGPTRFGKPEEIPTEAGKSGPRTEFADAADFLSAQKAGHISTTLGTVVKIGKIPHIMTQQGWAPLDKSRAGVVQNTSAPYTPLPNLDLPRVQSLSARRGSM